MCCRTCKMKPSMRWKVPYPTSVVGAVDPLARSSALRVNRGRNGFLCGSVELTIRRWVNIIAHRYRKSDGQDTARMMRARGSIWWHHGYEGLRSQGKREGKEDAQGTAGSAPFGCAGGHRTGGPGLRVVRPGGAGRGRHGLG